MIIYLIRHGRTSGNEEGRYAGATDHLLSEAGEAACRAATAPQVQRVYASPMRRCLQTANLLFAQQQPMTLQGLREYNFGEFENKNYEELKDLPAYQAFISSVGKIAPPGGEEWQPFRTRCCDAFILAVDDALKQGDDSIAVVTHGGVIMAIMERFGVPRREAYAWQVDNIGGFVLTVDVAHWADARMVKLVTRLDEERKNA